MSAARNWANAWIADWVDADGEPWCTRVAVRGLTDAQALRNVEYKLREASEQRVASLTIHHDPWMARVLCEQLSRHPLVNCVYCRTKGEILAYLAYSSRS